MAYILSILRNFWASLISYLQCGKRELKPGDDQLHKQLTEYEQTRKQLQQRHNLLASLLLQVLTWYKQIKTQLKDATDEKESLKQTVQELQQQSATLEKERNEAREVLTKLHLKNTLLEQKVEQLESHKKVLIQELGGSLSSQDIEFITWDFLIQKVKEITNQLDEVMADNQSLSKTNKDLEQKRDYLTKELNNTNNTNIRLKQNYLQIQSDKNSLESELRQTDRSKPLERAKNKLEQEKAQLEINLQALNQVESKFHQAESKVEELKLIIQRLEVELKQEKAKFVPLEQRIETLEQVKKQLETEVKQEKNRTTKLEPTLKDFKQVRSKRGSEVGNLSNENSQLNKEICQLNQTINQLTLRKNQLEFKRRSSDSNDSNNRLKQPEFLERLDVVEQYNELIYFVQNYLSGSELEELNNWVESEEFCLEIVKRLCFIDTMLVAKIEFLEGQIYSTTGKNSIYNLIIDYDRAGKAIFWNNYELRWELNDLFIKDNY